MQDFNLPEFGKCGVYKITNELNGHLYIGSTHTSFKKRRAQHISYSKCGKNNCTSLQRAFTKYGIENFSFEILISTPLKEYILKLEQHYLDTLRPEYNICKSAEHSRLGVKATEETKQRMRKPKTKQHSENIRKARLGKIPSVQCMEAMKKANTGRKKTPEEIEKHRINSTGKKQSKKAIEMLRLRSMGNKYSLGRKPSKWQIQRIKETHTGKTVSQETREKLSKIFKGHKRGPDSLETRAKKSASLIGNTRCLGRTHTEEAKAKMRANWDRRRLNVN